jgi:deoxyadenosine/deoxycytidine kinase
MNRPLILCIDGVPGVGKTTLCRALYHDFLKKNIEVTLHTECINETFLSAYLDNMSTYSFSFQLYMAMNKLKIYADTESQGVSIIDRSIFGDMSFARVQQMMCVLSEKDYKLYLDIIKPQVSDILLRYGAEIKHLYLDCTPEVALTRIQKRGIPSETQTYTTDYLSNLRDAYISVVGDAGINYTTLEWNSDRLVNGKLILPTEISDILGQPQ